MPPADWGSRYISRGMQISYTYFYKEPCGGLRLKFLIFLNSLSLSLKIVIYIVYIYIINLA